MPERTEYGLARDDYDVVDESPGESLAVLNGWLDGFDPDVAALRAELGGLDARSLEVLDRGIEPRPEGVGWTGEFWKDVKDLCGSLRDSLDNLSGRDEDFDRQGAANAASWSAFSRMQEGMASGVSFDVLFDGEAPGPVERNMLTQFVGGMQQAFSECLAGVDVDRDRSVERMNAAVAFGVSAAVGQGVDSMDTFDVVSDYIRRTY